LRIIEDLNLQLINLIELIKRI